VVRAVTKPTNEELPAASSVTQINDLFDCVFFEAVGSEDWSRLRELTVQEYGGVVGKMRF
jgi:hypothetical protein